MPPKKTIAKKVIKTVTKRSENKISKKIKDDNDMEDPFTRLIRLHDIKCPKCNSRPDKKSYALDGGSFSCSNKNCKSGRYHFCRNDKTIKFGLPMECCNGSNYTEK
jgi:hypothetical protein